MADKVYAGVVGLVVRLVLLDNGAVHDPSSATVKEITFTRPGGAKVVRNQASGVTVGMTDEEVPRPCLEYTTLVGEMDLPGEHKAIGYLEDAAGKWPAKPAKWRVYPSQR